MTKKARIWPFARNTESVHENVLLLCAHVIPFPIPSTPISMLYVNTCFGAWSRKGLLVRPKLGLQLSSILSIDLHTNVLALFELLLLFVRVNFQGIQHTQACPRRDLWRATISATWDFELRKSKLFAYSNEVDFVDAVDFVAYNCQQRYTNFLH